LIADNKESRIERLKTFNNESLILFPIKKKEKGKKRL